MIKNNYTKNHEPFPYYSPYKKTVRFYHCKSPNKIIRKMPTVIRDINVISFSFLARDNENINNYTKYKQRSNKHSSSPIRKGLAPYKKEASPYVRLQAL